MASDVFISYSRTDRPYVDQLAGHLRGAGLTVWFDEQIDAGQPFAQRIQNAIEGCVAFVPVLTPLSSASPWVQREIGYADELGKPILPLMLVECRQPLATVGLQHENVTGGRLPSLDYVARLRGLAGLVTGQAPAPSGARTQLSPRADTPVAPPPVAHTPVPRAAPARPPMAAVAPPPAGRLASSYGQGLRPPQLAPRPRRYRHVWLAAVVIMVAASVGTFALLDLLSNRSPASGPPLRGKIIVDGTPIAYDQVSGATSRRAYVQGAAEYAQLIGAPPSAADGGSGIERLFDASLRPSASTAGADVTLSIRRQVQDAAYRSLLSNTAGASSGAVIALDPTTGAVLALVSSPSYDPNQLVTGDQTADAQARQRLTENPFQQLLDRAISPARAPGTAFDVLVAAAALTNGASPDTVLTGGARYTAPGGGAIVTNQPGVACPDQITLADAVRVGCATAFASYGVEHLGASRLSNMTSAFGFDTTPLFDHDSSNVLGVAVSTGGHPTNAGNLAQNCVGLHDVQMTPLQAALVAETIANDGVQMRPYLASAIRTADGAVQHVTPAQLRQPLSRAVNDNMRGMLSGAVDQGVAQRAAISGLEVGGFATTASDAGLPDNGWFLGYVRDSGRPVVAVAVFLENAGARGRDAAAIIAADVMRAAVPTQ
jgi:peptidoglycan glycosyltransferase